MQLKDNQPGSFAIQAQDVKGNPVTLAAGAQASWAINDPTLADISPSSDSLSCVVTPKGPLGKTQVTISIPAVGTEPAMNAAGDLEVIASDAVSVTLVGTPS